ncbi:MULTISPECIES: IS110 family transposase [unclassified Sulfitobacter]|uniref:IS110 family transposase n=1 Tax=unclassified Sulfitobacter TaxID=196795 RepID=UPI0007C3E2C6|nr:MULTISPECIES: transposase [unclassified Sulfitobacter]KZX97662.1 hypothetical protein A3720_17810 [Sulfitobacter sp. HI0021]KZY01760.1 hypothetical protein A3722_07665 [Sulfitobacter sp. HI0027]|tara:strand:- start:325 stop:783 length:459 start_codon:yes stop_codon:yes gene_type:complete
MEEMMGVFAALDVSQDETAVCVVSQDGAILAETKVKTCPDAIADWLSTWVGELERVGMETGPLAVWLWNALAARNLPIICLDARHASGVLNMMPNKTDRHDARPLADRANRLVQSRADQKPRGLCQSGVLPSCWQQIVIYWQRLDYVAISAV